MSQLFIVCNHHLLLTVIHDIVRAHIKSGKIYKRTTHMFFKQKHNKMSSESQVCVREC